MEVFMKTTYAPKPENAKALLDLAHAYQLEIDKKPERFIKKMRTNDSFLVTVPQLLENGLQPRNPLVAVIGDSVTAGHFEWIMPIPEIREIMNAMAQGKAQYPMPTMEIYDTQNSYVEKFRQKLIEKYERTAVSIVNAGIAGDNLVFMSQRLERDVISLQPDLVIINGSINWGSYFGTADDFKKILIQMVQDIKAKTTADIVLLTPNMDLYNYISEVDTDLYTRIPKIREVALEEDVCFVDVYSIWKAYEAKGYDVKDLLANGINHPCIAGHEAYAIALMKLFED